MDKVIEVTLRRCSGGYTVVEGVACAMEGEKGWADSMRSLRRVKTQEMMGWDDTRSLRMG